MTTLGNRLRSQRYLADMTLKEAGQRAGVSVSFLSDIERGKSNPSVPTLQRLAAAYGTSADSLLTGHVVAQPMPDDRREDAIAACHVPVSDSEWALRWAGATL